jgi:hypothetical protein
MLMQAVWLHRAYQRKHCPSVALAQTKAMQPWKIHSIVFFCPDFGASFCLLPLLRPLSRAAAATTVQ